VTADLAAFDWLMLASGVAGFIAALLLATPGLRSLDSRATLVKLAELKVTITNQSLLVEQEKALLQKALRELAEERRYVLAGLALLALSFVLSIFGTLAGVEIS
jgi:hypothetical protein